MSFYVDSPVLLGIYTTGITILAIHMYGWGRPAGSTAAAMRLWGLVAAGAAVGTVTALAAAAVVATGWQS